MLVSRLAVGCPLLSTLVKSNGADCIALKGSGAAAGLFALPFTAGLPRVDVVLLYVPLAGEARIVVELEAPVVIGTCTMLAGSREYVWDFVYVGCSQVEISYIIDIEWVETKDWRSVWQLLEPAGPSRNVQRISAKWVRRYRRGYCILFRRRTSRWKSSNDFVVAAQNCSSWAYAEVVVRSEVFVEGK